MSIQRRSVSGRTSASMVEELRRSRCTMRSDGAALGVHARSEASKYAC